MEDFASPSRDLNPVAVAPDPASRYGLALDERGLIPGRAMVSPPVVYCLFSGFTNTTLTANQAYYARFFIPYVFKPGNFNVFINGSSGNLDVGIYTDLNGLPNTRLWSRGSFASPGTGLRSVAISAGAPTQLILQPGTYWMAWAADNATIDMQGYNNRLPLGLGANQSSAFPLPATAGAAAINASWAFTLTA